MVILLATMEENQNPEVQQTQQVVETPQENVSFAPVSAKPKSKGKVKTFLGIFILVIFIVGGFLIFKDSGEKTPEVEGTFEESEEEVVVSSPTPTSEPADKEEVTISIQNGTGIVGEAAYIRDILKVAGFSVFKIGNADTTDNITTKVTYLSSLSETTKDEITEKLESVYKEVTVANSSTQTDEVVVVTGLRKGSTAKPSATSTPTASSSATPSASPTATP